MTTPDQKFQELIAQNQELNTKLLEYRDCSTQSSTQITKDVQTLNQCLNNMEKNIQVAISTTITQSLVHLQSPK